ncbi:hypothetical protein [Hymenobacter sp. DG01]|uniref:hypothetical protein n=1 Tax=Hymenobacter sp. DG01 TaxID=2584940 RepID=UPI00111F489E|nr:hypothetical protein [Hymenobacter sp. DG01]
MTLRYLSSIAFTSTAIILSACDRGQKPTPIETTPLATQVPSATELATVPLNAATVLTAMYGGGVGDSAVYDGSKQVESSNPDKHIVAKVLQNQRFQRHDSTLSLVVTKNSFEWGAGIHNGWVDAALFHFSDGKWQLLKTRRQAVIAGSFGTCDCQVQMQRLHVGNDEKIFAFVRSYNVHQGESETFSVITEDLLTSKEGFTTYDSQRNECEEPSTGEVPKTGFFVTRQPGHDDQIELVSYEPQTTDGRCAWKDKHRSFTYTQLIQEMQKPQSAGL